MAVASLKANVVRVAGEQGEGGWFYATSPDMKGLLVTQPSIESLYAAVPQAIIDLYAAKDIEVIVARIDSSECGTLQTWVALAATPVRLALAM